MMRKNKRWHPSQETDDLVFAVCDRFLKQLGRQFEVHDQVEEIKRSGAASAVADWVRQNWGRDDLTREKIYPLFWEAARRDFLLLRPPRERSLAKQITERYGLAEFDHDPETFQVVNTRGPDAFGHVACVGADLVHLLVKRLGQQKKSVHVGLGAGFAAMVVAKRLAQLVYSDQECPNLVFHALSAGGFLVDKAEKVPVTWFGYFHDVLPKVECVALFSETVVPIEEYDRVVRNPGVRNSFRRAEEIDIVVTSLASASDPHGLLGQYLEHLKATGDLPPQWQDRIEEVGWVGDVQFRPYNQTGPIDDVFPVKAVTLVEIPDLVRMARTPEKHVVLLGGPCGECARPKSDAIEPLLTHDDLRVWSHLITDVETACELLAK